METMPSIPNNQANTTPVAISSVSNNSSDGLNTQIAALANRLLELETDKNRQIRSAMTYAQMQQNYFLVPETYNNYLKSRKVKGGGYTLYFPWANLLYYLDNHVGYGCYSIEFFHEYQDTQPFTVPTTVKQRTVDVNQFRTDIACRLTIHALDGDVTHRCLAETTDLPSIGDGVTNAQAAALRKVCEYHGIGRHLKAEF